MAGYLYAFQAKSIQAYVLEGGKLVDLAGASAIVDDIARPEGGDGLGCILDLLGQKPDILRRAGGAFTVWSDSKAQLDAIRAAMTLHIQIAAPGLDFVDAWVSAPSVGEALDEIEARLVAARTLPVVSLPALPPQTLRAPRTGGGAVSRDPARENVPVDDATRQKRAAAKRSQHDRLSLFERRLLLKIPGGFRWPVDFDETSAEAKPAPRDRKRVEALFPFRMIDHRAFPNTIVGIVHADGNGIGKAIIALNPAARKVADAPGLLKDVSDCLARAAEAAAISAIEAVLIPEAKGRSDTILAARPVVLGGDDITMIIRGDLALPWTIHYLRAFKTETKQQFSDLADAMAGAKRAAHAATVREHFAPGFSAGAGIAFVKASQPFDRAYGLCESLAKHAKDHAKAAANGGMARSLVSFHRLTTSVFENYGGDDGILKNQITLADGGRLTLNPYDADAPADDDALPGAAASAFPSAEALVQLARTIEADDFPAGPLRQVLSKATQHPATALADYQRWRKFNQRQDDRKQAIAAFDTAMGALLPGIAIETTFFSSGNSPATPIFDALSLNAAGRGDGE